MNNNYEIIRSICVIFFILATCSFFMGFHNADMCQNFRYLEERFNTKLVEHNLKNEQVSINECYLTGLRLQFISYLMFFITFILLYLGGKEYDN